MRSTRRYNHRTIAALLCLAFSARLVAGDLNPPGGPIAATMRTLNQVEPRIVVNAAITPGDADSVFRITKSGSYYLTGDVHGVAGKHGIKIDAEMVTLDLGGFLLSGFPGSLDAIHVTTANASLTIRNGNIRGWDEVGINGHDGNGPILVEDISVAHTVEVGIVVPATSTVTRCRVQAGGVVGIASAEEVSVTHCAVSDSGRIGIAVSWGSTVSHCTSARNGQEGISVGSDSVITNCAARHNGSAGIVVGPGATVSDCAAGGNTGAGIYGQAGASVSRCSVRDNAVGIEAFSGCLVEGCTASANKADGIKLANSGTALNNVCRGNGTAGAGAGVLATGVANRIDGNHSIDNDYGIRLNALDNLVVRNSARNNTSGNYSFPVGGEYGQIITNPGANFAATNPWANFAY